MGLSIKKMQSMQIEEFKWRLHHDGTVFDYIDNLENENKELKEKLDELLNEGIKRMTKEFALKIINSEPKEQTADRIVELYETIAEIEMEKREMKILLSNVSELLNKGNKE